jgi:mannose-1-phosphate guanylyltransferase/mannose-6-phosphate isomerase
MTSSIVPLLLCGGGGTRLWPLSTDAAPKQFLRLFGDRSLFQDTLLRTKAAGAEHAVVIGNSAHGETMRREAAELDGGSPVCTFLLEPTRRDSAAAIAAGMAFIAERFGPDSVVVVLPCDHRIPDHAAFAEAVDKAAATARCGFLTTFGITPTHPATGYGYIRLGTGRAGDAGAFGAAAFVEKPDASRAAAYCVSGDHFWNSGMFVFTAALFLAEAGRLMPEVTAAAARAVTRGAATDAGVVLDAEAFAAAPRISIDYALFEKSDRVAVLPVSFAWSDVGAWDAVHEAGERDASGLCLRGDAVAKDAKDTLIVAEGVKVAALGVKDLVIVATPSGVLVVDRRRAGEIKSLLE